MKIAIIGTGHMGSWLAKELSKAHEIAVYNRHPEKAKELAKTIGRITVLPSIAALADFKPGMLINAVSLQDTIPVFEECVKCIPKTCMLCDVTSIKTGIPEYYSKCGLRFVSLHPMFGPTFANVESLEKENAVIIKESDPEGAEFFRKFFSGFRINLYNYTFDEHDRTMAYSLSTPFVSTMVFAACMDAKAVPGTTFARHMAIAKGLLSEDDSLLVEILFNPYTVRELEKITSRLEHLKHIIRARDGEEMRKFISSLRKNINGPQ